MLPIFKNSNKQDIQFKELLSHYARLQPLIPFIATVDKTGTLGKYYKKESQQSFPPKWLTVFI
jgi:hypothetical protein